MSSQMSTLPRQNLNSRQAETVERLRPPEIWLSPLTAPELPPDAACDEDPLELDEALGLLPPPQPASSRAVPAMTTSELMEWRGFTAISVRL